MVKYIFQMEPERERDVTKQALITNIRIHAISCSDGLKPSEAIF